MSHLNLELGFCHMTSLESGTTLVSYSYLLEESIIYQVPCLPQSLSQGLFLLWKEQNSYLLRSKSRTILHCNSLLIFWLSFLNSLGGELAPCALCYMTLFVVTQQVLSAHQDKTNPLKPCYRSRESILLMWGRPDGRWSYHSSRSLPEGLEVKVFQA